MRFLLLLSLLATAAISQPPIGLLYGLAPDDPTGWRSGTATREASCCLVEWRGEPVVLTAGHVVADVPSLMVVGADGRETIGAVTRYARDDRHDIGALRPAAAPYLRALPLAQRMPPVGTACWWWGTDGRGRPISRQVMVRATGDLGDPADPGLGWLGISVPQGIDAGCSGGPVVTGAGELIGITSNAGWYGKERVVWCASLWQIREVPR